MSFWGLNSEVNETLCDWLYSHMSLIQCLSNSLWLKALTLVTLPAYNLRKLEMICPSCFLWDVGFFFDPWGLSNQSAWWWCHELGESYFRRTVSSYWPTSWSSNSAIIRKGQLIMADKNLCDLCESICAYIKLSRGSRWKQDNIFQQPKKANVELQLNSF